MQKQKLDFCEWVHNFTLYLSAVAVGLNGSQTCLTVFFVSNNHKLPDFSLSRVSWAHLSNEDLCVTFSHLYFLVSYSRKKQRPLNNFSFRKVNLTLPLCSNGAAASMWAFLFHCGGWICAARQHEQLSPLASRFQGILLVQLSQSEEQPEGTATLTCLLR